VNEAFLKLQRVYNYLLSCRPVDRGALWIVMDCQRQIRSEVSRCK
jgi:hypothetical protein